jgi:hypothetical protein
VCGFEVIAQEVSGRKPRPTRRVCDQSGASYAIPATHSLVLATDPHFLHRFRFEVLTVKSARRLPEAGAAPPERRTKTPVAAVQLREESSRTAGGRTVGTAPAARPDCQHRRDSAGCCSGCRALVKAPRKYPHPGGLRKDRTASRRQGWTLQGPRLTPPHHS